MHRPGECLTAGGGAAGGPRRGGYNWRKHLKGAAAAGAAGAAGTAGTAGVAAAGGGRRRREGRRRRREGLATATVRPGDPVTEGAFSDLQNASVH